MKSGGNVLWSTDIFPAQSGSAAGAAVGGPVGAAAGAVAGALGHPDQERAYLRYGRQILQNLAVQPDRQARLQEISERIAAGDDAFDIDQLRTAFTELVRRDALELVERDPLSGNHLFRLTRSGWIMAA